MHIIISSPTDVQPTLDAIAASAATLCEATNGGVFRFDGTLIHLMAHHNWSPDELAAVQRVFPIPPGRGSVTARAILTGTVAHVPDQATDPEYIYGSLTLAGVHTVLSVPMLRDGNPIGALTVTRREAKPFTEQQIALLKTFADQAMIVIENVRLFQELQARNAELTETLARQTATGEVLRAISRAQTNAQPVFDIIAASTLRLCGGGHSGVWLYDGELIHLTAFENVNPEGAEALRRAYPMRVGERSATGRALLARVAVQVPDVLEDPAYRLRRQSQGQRQDAYNLLAPVYTGFAGGFDTADVQEARTLLEDLADGQR